MHGEYKMPGGKLVVVDLQVSDGRLADVQLSGDFFLEPDHALRAIDTALEGLRADLDRPALAAAINAGLPAGVMMYGVSTVAIAEAIHRALHPGDDA